MSQNEKKKDDSSLTSRERSNSKPNEDSEDHESKDETSGTGNAQHTVPQNDEPLSDDECAGGLVTQVGDFLSTLLRKGLVLSTEKVLGETSVDGIAQYIIDHPNLKIITMVGAGISTAAGIPDFRSPGTGIYDNLKEYNLPYTNAIFELDYFLSNPEPFYKLASEILPGCYKPTKAHYFIKLLDDKNLLLRHYSQNIDNLDRLCGISEDKLVEAHGTFYTSHCTKCRKAYSLEWLQDKVGSKVIPKCIDCGHIVKPDIIFFGESLPRKFFQHASDFAKCDLLIIMGSSLVVEPFASLVTLVRDSVPRLMINATDIGRKYNLKFSVPDNGKDVLWIGNCDDGCELLAEKLGWKEELEKLCKKEDETSTK